MKKSLKVKTPIENTHDLLQAIKSALVKLNTSSTVSTGLAELKEIMQMHITNNARMNTLLAALSEPNERMNLSQKREAAKVYGLMGEVFTESLIPFLGKVIASIKGRWDEPALHISLSDSFGIMIHHVFKGDQEDRSASFRNIVRALLDIVKESKQESQIGAAMCLTRAIQNGPSSALPMLLPDLTYQMIAILKIPGVKCLGQLLEILISLAVTGEQIFDDYAVKFVPIVIEYMSPKQEWTIRKLAIDTIYTFASVFPKVLVEQNTEITTLLKQAKADKSKHIRDAAHIALTKLKEGQAPKAIMKGQGR